MFCEESVKYNKGYFYIQHHGVGDVPWEHRSVSERYNPLRYSIGIRTTKNEPPRLRINKNAILQRKWSNFNWWLWKRRYRAIFVCQRH